jgi:hypothetical protein
VQNLPVGNILTIEELKAFRDSVGAAYTFTEDYSVYATATTDESSGNFYKEIYVQDGSDAIQLRMTNSGGLYEGDSVRIYLKGTTIDIFKGMFQLDGVDTDDNIIKQATGKSVTPAIRTLTNINPDADRGLLIEIADVEFDQASIGATWSDATTQQDINHNLLDCNLNSIIVRTSGYANFAEEIIPEFNGNFIGIVGIYTNELTPSLFTTLDLQLYIREPSELGFTEPRCTGGGTVTCDPLASMIEDFSTHGLNNTITGNCWNSEATDGSLRWSCKDNAGDKYAEASISGTSTSTNEMWMITPEITYSASADMLSFQSTHQNWNHDGLTVWVSSNYNGSNAGTATWTQLTATFAGTGDASGTWISSGNISLSSLGLSGIYHIGFKYNASGSGGQTTTYKIDNILIN